MTDLTPEALDAIEARANAATPGPWAHENNRVIIPGPDDSLGKNWEPDAEFIAHAREDIPALVSSYREQQAELRRLRTENEEQRVLMESAADAMQVCISHRDKVQAANTVLGERYIALQARIGVYVEDPIVREALLTPRATPEREGGA